MKRLLPLFSLLALLSFACALTGAPLPSPTGEGAGGGGTHLETATPPQVPTGTTAAPTATIGPTLPPPIPTSGERPCLPSERLFPIPNPDPNGPSFHQVFIATSSDGLTWQTDNQVVIDQASVPEAVRLPDGVRE